MSPPGRSSLMRRLCTKPAFLLSELTNYQLLLDYLGEGGGHYRHGPRGIGDDAIAIGIDITGPVPITHQSALGNNYYRMLVREFTLVHAYLGSYCKSFR